MLGSWHTRGGQHQVCSKGVTDIFQMGRSAVFRLMSSGEITDRSLSSVSKRVSSRLIALRTLVSIGVTWISEVFGHVNNATKRLLGSGRSRFPSHPVSTMRRRQRRQ